jgi:DNA-directed RNA polymerase specialized sigma24 family protein
VPCSSVFRAGTLSRHTARSASRPVGKAPPLPKRELRVLTPPSSHLSRVSPSASLTCMPPGASEDLSRTVETLYRSESGRILATLVRLLGDLDLAEEAIHEAFAAALDTWPQAGIPDKPRPWLISTARCKAIDGMRRRARLGGAQKDLALYLDARVPEASPEDEIEDDRLRLIFTCCHPALPPEGQVALTLRSLRPYHRGDRAGISRDAGDACATHRSRESRHPR